jgi:predicted nucleic acid-binding protein
LDARELGPLVTSDYVLDELLTLLKARYGVPAALEAGEALWSERFSTLGFLTPSDIQEAWQIFRGIAIRVGALQTAPATP